MDDKTKKKINNLAKKYIRTVKDYLVKTNGYEDADEGQLESLENSYRMFLNAQHAIETEGYFLNNRFGDVIAHPAVKMANDAKIQLNKALELMGVVQKIRLRDTIKNAPTEEDCLLDKFIKGE